MSNSEEVIAAILSGETSFGSSRSSSSSLSSEKDSSAHRKRSRAELEQDRGGKDGYDSSSKMEPTADPSEMELTAQLIWSGSEEAEEGLRHIDLSNRKIFFGRQREDNDYVLDSKQYPKTVSRRHALIECSVNPATGQKGHQIIDLGSLNGLVVNGQQVRRQFLKDGDVIAFGNSPNGTSPCKFIYKLDRSPAPTLLSRLTISEPPKGAESSAESEVHSSQRDQDAKLENSDELRRQLAETRETFSSLTEEVKCCICFEYFVVATILPACSHVFCALCLKGWMKGHHECPTCRAKITSMPVRNRVVDALVESIVKTLPAEEQSAWRTRHERDTKVLRDDAAAATARRVAAKNHALPAAPMGHFHRPRGRQHLLERAIGLGLGLPVQLVAGIPTATPTVPGAVTQPVANGSEMPPGHHHHDPRRNHA